MRSDRQDTAASADLFREILLAAYCTRCGEQYTVPSVGKSQCTAWKDVAGFVILFSRSRFDPLSLTQHCVIDSIVQVRRTLRGSKSPSACAQPITEWELVQAACDHMQCSCRALQDRHQMNSHVHKDMTTALRHPRIRPFSTLGRHYLRLRNIGLLLDTPINTAFRPGAWLRQAASDTAYRGYIRRNPVAPTDAMLAKMAGRWTLESSRRKHQLQPTLSSLHYRMAST